jgi:cytochrome c oxidase assembly protein subunit 15
VVSIAIIAFTMKIWRESQSRNALGKSAIALIALLGVQIYLGAMVIWTVRNPHAATFHMLNGAFLLSICWMMTLRSLKFRLEAPHLSERAPETDAPLGELEKTGHA